MPIVLQYHEIRGLASPIRMMLEYAGIPYTNKYAENWRTGTNEKAQVAKVNALANLPALFEEDGSIVTQSCAVNFHVGEKAGLNGSTPAERSRVDQINAQVMDWRNDAVRVFYAERTATTFEKHARSVHTHCAKLEGWFRRSGFVFSAANRPTTGDFHLFEMIDQHEEFARAFNEPSFVTQYPLLQGFYARFYSLPQLQAYFAGPLHRLPINHPTYASFGFDSDATKLREVEGDPEVGPIKVGYWKIRGLAAPLRMMCSYAGAEFESVEYECTGSGSKGFDRSAWSDKAKPALKDKNPLMNLPYVQHGKELVTQSNACVLYLGRKFGLLGANPEQEVLVQQVMWETTDWRNNAVSCFYKADQSPEAAAAFQKRALVHFTKMEGWMAQHGTKFTAGDQVTASDFHVFEMLDQHELYAQATGLKSFLEGHPLLAAFHKRVRELPQLAEYFSGRMYKLPINNLTAGFGADADSTKLHAYTSQ